MKATNIKHGWQCRVYIYPTYVIKKQRPLKMVKAAVVKWLHMEASSKRAILKRSFKVYSNLNRAKCEIQKSDVPLKFLGNLKFYKDGRMRQQRAVTLRIRLRNLIRKNDKQAMRDIIDQFIALNLELWKYGIFEKIFNFPRNNGVVRKHVILLDPFELLYKRQDIIKRLKEKPWLHFLDNVDFPPDVRRYYIKKCEEAFTVKNFKILWKSKKIVDI